MTTERLPIHLLLVDDHAIVRRGLRALIDTVEHIKIVGEADSVESAIAQAALLLPDIVLMDVRLPDGTGIDACREIRSARPQTHVLFLTSFADDEALLATLLAGGDGYLLKEIDDEALIRAIETVARGQAILDATMVKRMVAHMSSFVAPAPASARHDTLTEQERKVLALVAEGHTNKGIAAKLGLSEKTVRNYLSTVFQKLNVSRRSEAAVAYTRNRTP